LVEYVYEVRAGLSWVYVGRLSCRRTNATGLLTPSIQDPAEKIPPLTWCRQKTDREKD